MNYEPTDRRVYDLNETFYNGHHATVNFYDHQILSLVIYVDIVREKHIDTDYELWTESTTESSVNSNVIYTYLRMTKEIYAKNDRMLNSYFTGGISYEDMRKREIPTLEGGTWAYYVYTKTGTEVANKVKDISVELNKVNKFSDITTELAGIKFNPKGGQKNVRHVYDYLNNLISSLNCQHH